ncbi:hypothetical protein PO909_002544 [Leuciscus waleckii]
MIDSAVCSVSPQLAQINGTPGNPPDAHRAQGCPDPIHGIGIVAILAQNARSDIGGEKKKIIYRYGVERYVYSY